MEIEYENCVMCKIKTDVPVNKDVNYRLGYIEGAGQFCADCWQKVFPRKKDWEIL